MTRIFKYNLGTAVNYSSSYLLQLDFLSFLSYLLQTHILLNMVYNFIVFVNCRVLVPAIIAVILFILNYKVGIDPGVMQRVQDNTSSIICLENFMYRFFLTQSNITFGNKLLYKSRVYAWL